MAIDFPNSPSNGQIFTSGTRSWQWDGAVWNIYYAKPVITVQDSAPSSPASGDQWFESDTGRWLIYYDNAWVEIGNSNDIGQIPVGTVNQYAGSSAPTGWLICDGTAISRTTYASLFSVIGTTYGAGNGSTTFALPNLKGKIPVGYDAAQTEFDVLGETGGAKTHTLITSEMPSHTHTQSSHSHSTNNILSGNDVVVTSSSYRIDYQINRYADSATFSLGTTSAQPAIQSEGGGGAHNNLQPYIVLNYIIKV